jgi:hypothetical protein
MKTPARITGAPVEFLTQEIRTQVHSTISTPSCCACHLLSRWYLARLIFSSLKKKAICFSETSVYFQRTTLRYIPEDSTLHNHRCENIKSYCWSICPITVAIRSRRHAIFYSTTFRIVGSSTTGGMSVILLYACFPSLLAP